MDAIPADARERARQILPHPAQHRMRHPHLAQTVPPQFSEAQLRQVAADAAHRHFAGAEQTQNVPHVAAGAVVAVAQQLLDRPHGRRNHRAQMDRMAVLQRPPDAMDQRQQLVEGQPLPLAVHFRAPPRRRDGIELHRARAQTLGQFDQALDPLRVLAIHGHDDLRPESDRHQMADAAHGGGMGAGHPPEPVVLAGVRAVEADGHAPEIRLFAQMDGQIPVDQRGVGLHGEIQIRGAEKIDDFPEFRMQRRLAARQLGRRQPHRLGLRDRAFQQLEIEAFPGHGLAVDEGGRDPAVAAVEIAARGQVEIKHLQRRHVRRHLHHRNGPGFRAQPVAGLGFGNHAPGSATTPM